MLTFTKENDMFIFARNQALAIIGVLFCTEKNRTWRVWLISSTSAEPDHLRQIADKIDELNGADDGIS